MPFSYILGIYTSFMSFKTVIVYSFHIVTFSWGFNFSVCTVYKRNRTSYMGDVTGQRITPELQKVGLTTVNQFGNLNIIEPI